MKLGFGLDYEAQLRDDQRHPHLSLHQGGRVHVRKARPKNPAFLQAPGWDSIPLSAMTGQHCATVLFPLDALPEYAPSEPGHGGRAIRTNGVQSPFFKLLFYINGTQTKFDCQQIDVCYEIEHPSHGSLFLGTGLRAMLPETDYGTAPMYTGAVDQRR